MPQNVKATASTYRYIVRSCHRIVTAAKQNTLFNRPHCIINLIMAQAMLTMRGTPSLSFYFILFTTVARKTIELLFQRELQF
jgi:hypothetical protein